MKLICSISLVFFLSIASNQLMAITVGELVTGIDYLDCKDKDPLTTMICKKVMSSVRQQMKGIDLSIKNKDIIFQKSPIVQPGSIDTGHSCSHRAWIRSNYASVTVRSDAAVSIDSLSLSKPMALHLRLPIDFYANVDLKETWGTRTFWGDCWTFATDTYSGDMQDSMDIDTLIFLSLEPKMKLNGQGDFVITIEPLVDAQFVMQTDLNFDMHGKAPFNGVLTALSGGLSTMMQGEGLKQLLLDVGIGFVQTLLTVDSGLFNDFLMNIVEDLAAKKIDGYAPDIENLLQQKINAEVTRGLNLDENGQRTFTVSNKHIINLIMFILNFDADYYLTKNPSLATLLGNDPMPLMMHWLESGLKQGKAGLKEFNAQYYLNKNEDLKELFGNDYEAAFYHWLDYGKDEGREAACPLDSAGVPVNCTETYQSDSDNDVAPNDTPDDTTVPTDWGTSDSDNDGMPDAWETYYGFDSEDNTAKIISMNLTDGAWGRETGDGLAGATNYQANCWETATVAGAQSSTNLNNLRDSNCNDTGVVFGLTGPWQIGEWQIVNFYNQIATRNNKMLESFIQVPDGETGSINLSGLTTAFGGAVDIVAYVVRDEYWVSGDTGLGEYSANGKQKFLLNNNAEGPFNEASYKTPGKAMINQNIGNYVILKGVTGDSISLNVAANNGFAAINGIQIVRSDDADGDGVSNLNEYLNGTDPRDSDTNDNGISDGDELNPVPDTNQENIAAFIPAGSATGGTNPNKSIDGSFTQRASWDEDSTYWRDINTRVEFDYGEVFTITDIALSVDGDDDYTVEYSTDNLEWVQLTQISSNDGETSWGTDWMSTDDSHAEYVPSIDFAMPVQARYLRVYATSGDNSYSISEIAAYGY
jgi:hypothetical protein